VAPEDCSELPRPEFESSLSQVDSVEAAVSQPELAAQPAPALAQPPSALLSALDKETRGRPIRPDKTKRARPWDGRGCFIEQKLESPLLLRRSLCMAITW